MSAAADRVTEGPSILLVDDDPLFRQVLARALGRRGYAVSAAGSVDEALRRVAEVAPEFAVVDLKMPGDSGLVLIKVLLEVDPNTRIVMLTGYASITTAVEAIKLGAINYLVKPADTEQILAALGRSEGDAEAPVAALPLSVNRLEWEHIQRVLAQHQGNISATARALNMHRRTLQRKLDKRPVRA